MNVPFLERFRSNPESVVLRTCVQKERSEKGKLEANYVTYRRAPSARDVELHFAGKVCIVAKPDLADGTCTWGALDFDIYLDEDAIRLIRSKIVELGLPLHLFGSKSGGLHGYVFFKIPVPIEAAREQLSKWAAQLGYPNIEIFPKPVSKGKMPFGITLPYFGEPEQFKAFTAQLYDLPLNGGPAPKGNRGAENSGKNEPAEPPGILLPANVKDFGLLLKAHGLQFEEHIEEREGSVAYNYHNINGQGCLVQGTVHTRQAGNVRQYRFVVKNSRVSHQCFDSDCQGFEAPKTRTALERLGIRLDSQANQVSADEIAAVSELQLPDMPPEVLCGRLGDIYRKRMRDFAIAYAWPALLAAASVCSRVRPEMARIPVNLYVALVGPVGTGKSQAIERANNLLGVEPETVMAGSVEGLLAKIGDRNGDPVLLAPDELSHLLEKAQISNATFTYVLNRLFYHNDVDLTVTHRKPVSFRAQVSLVAGIVDEKFGDGFSSATTSGLYDRFMFGQCPSGFQYKYRPEEGVAEFLSEASKLAIPRINPNVWEERNRFASDEQVSMRLLDIGIRTALICAAFDGKEELCAKDLGHAWELARYQKRVRALLVPNPGKNHEAQVALKILSYLETHSANGKHLKLRDVLTATHAYEFGPAMCERVLGALCFAGDIEQAAIKNTRGRTIKLIRRIGAEE